MTPLLALSIVFLVYAFGDIVAAKTKAIISMMLVGSIVFLIAFWCGLPATVFQDSGLQAFASVTICMFLVHIGSTIKVQDFIDEWKTVVLVLITTLAIAFGTYAVCQFIMDKDYALAGSPVLAGAMVAYLIMQQAAEAVGRTDVAVFALMILCLQAFVGVPIASSLCRKEGNRILTEWKAGRYVPKAQQAEQRGTFSRFKVFPSVPEKYNSANLILFKTAVIALIAYELAQLTGFNQLIFALILGIFFHEVGILDEAALTKANGFSFVMAGALCSVFSGLASTTPQMILGMLLDIVLLIAIGVVILMVAAVILGKVLHFSWTMSISMAVTALFGFPGTYLVSREVAAACGQTEEEVQIVMGYLMPKMIISGIVSVSIVSGLAASVMCNWMV